MRENLGNLPNRGGSRIVKDNSQVEVVECSLEGGGEGISKNISQPKNRIFSDKKEYIKGVPIKMVL